MAGVFVSHASEDLALADAVRRWLSGDDHEVFLAQDLRDGIAVGDQWEQRLHERLRWADAVVCVVTSAYLASTWCIAEVAIAQSRGSRLLPLRAEPDVAHPLLKAVQHTDLARDPEAARGALAEALRRVDAAGGLGWPDDRSPFPGLRPFDTDQHRVFFGRTDEVEQLVELLRSPAEQAKSAALLIVGPSGCGKSSLVRAGLLPEMAGESDWRALSPILPGADPVAALARELTVAARRVELAWTVEHVRHQLDNGGLTGLADELLLADPSGPQRRLLVVVDQFEELLTQTAPAERARFAESLRPALTGPAQVVGTLRPEFLDQMLGDCALATLATTIYPLRPLHREALRLVIEGPARVAGIDVEDDLVARLVDNTDTGEALPLLAFTLAQLGNGVRRGGQLSAMRYDQLGGVQGALTRQADAALAEALSAGGRSREEVIAGLLRLVTVDEQGRPTRWRVLRDELPTPVVIELDAFVARRLLTTDTDNGTVVIGVVHEAFLSAWPPLAQAIAANASALRARRAVEHAVTEWHQNGRPRERLWGSGQLAAAVADVGARICAGNASPPGQQGRSRWLPRRGRVLVAERVDISPAARDFLHASIRRDRYHRRRATTVLSMLLILALAGAGIAVIKQGDAQEHQRIATARQLITQADAIRETDPRTALLLGIAAERIHPDPGGETRASLVNTLTTTRYAGTLKAGTDRVISVAFSSDGRTLATGDSEGTPTLWNLTDPARPRHSRLTGHPSAVTSVAFSSDGRTLATGSFDGTVILWDLTDPARPRRAPNAHTGSVSSMAFSPDGRTLATGSFDGPVILWDLTDPARPQPLGAPLTGHAETVFSTAFSPDGRTLATGDSAGIVILWDLTDPVRPRQSLTAHAGTVNSVAFAPDGRTLATAGDDRTTRLWDLTDRAQPRPLGSAPTNSSSNNTSRVIDVAFSSDGRILATVGDDGAVMLWDLTDRAQPESLGSALTSNTSRAASVAFAPGRLATGVDNGTVLLWRLTDRAVPQPLGWPLTGQPGPVDSVRFTTDGRSLAVTSPDGTVLPWDLTNPDQPRPEPPQTRPSSGVDSLASTPDGNTIVTADDPGSAILRDVTDGDQFPLGQPLTGHHGLVTTAAFTPDGQTLATASEDGTVILRDVTDRNRPRPLGQPLTGHTSQVTSVAFAGNGRTLATVGDDGRVILWDLSDRNQPRRLGEPLRTGDADPVSSVALAPEGNILATGGFDGTVSLWDLTDLNQLREHATQRACAITGRGLNSDQWDRYIPGLPYQDTCPLMSTGGDGSR